MEIPKIPECFIDNCEPFRIGITVNFIFFALAVAVTIMMHVALKPKDQIGEAIMNEFRIQGSHIGYSLYLVSGCAFFGVFPATKLQLINYVTFGEAWTIGLLVLLLFEMIGYKMTESSNIFTKTRILAIFVSGLSIYWVWMGPIFLEG